MTTESVVQRVLDALAYGDDVDKIEAITRIVGRAHSLFLIPVVDDEVRRNKLERELQRGRLMLQGDTENAVKERLHELARQGNALVCWHATTALVELGDTSPAVGQHLIDMARQVLQSLVEPQRESGSLLAGGLESAVKDDTFRALSRFRGNELVLSLLMDALQGQDVLGGWERGSGVEAVYALGAIGDPTARPSLEYWATNKGDTHQGKAASIALIRYGTASYDELEAQSEKQREKAAGGCLVATAATGTPASLEVRILQEFRDRCLAQTPLGRSFILVYYRVSPTIRPLVASSGLIRQVVRCGIVVPAARLAQRRLARSVRQ